MKEYRIFRNGSILGWRDQNWVSATKGKRERHNDDLVIYDEWNDVITVQDFYIN